MKAFLRLIIGRCLIPALPVMLLISASAHAAEISPLEGLEMARKGFAGMTDFTAEITQEKQIALLKKTMRSSGQVRFRRPDTFYMEVYSPYASRLLLKDNILAMFLPTEGIRQKTVLPPKRAFATGSHFLTGRSPDSLPGWNSGPTVAAIPLPCG